MWPWQSHSRTYSLWRSLTNDGRSLTFYCRNGGGCGTGESVVAERVSRGCAGSQQSSALRFGLDSLRFGVQTGEISLKQLLVLPLSERRDVVESGPVIDFYLGGTRVYKRTTRTLLFAIC